MDYYNIDLFEPISTDKLQDYYNKGKTITEGNIFIYGDSLGKTGDIHWSLKKIVLNQEKLVFEFDESLIEINDPNHIVMNEKLIAIRSSSKIIWKDQWFNVILEYKWGIEDLTTRTILGNHGFRTKKKDNALVFSTW